MTRADQHPPISQAFFEGTEKKVELVVAPEAGSLRDRGHAFWDDVVAACRARTGR